jgi:hypothetical protein
MEEFRHVWRHYQGVMVDVEMGFMYAQVFDHPWEAEQYVLARLQRGVRGVVKWYENGEYKDHYRV